MQRESSKTLIIIPTSSHRFVVASSWEGTLAQLQ